MSIGAPVSRSPVPDTATLRAVVAFNRKPAKAIVQLLPEHLNAACRTGPARTMTTPCGHARAESARTDVFASPSATHPDARTAHDVFLCKFDHKRLA